MNVALERTLKLKFKTTGSSSPSILTKFFFSVRQLGGGLGPLGPPCLRQWSPPYNMKYFYSFFGIIFQFYRSPRHWSMCCKLNFAFLEILPCAFVQQSYPAAASAGGHVIQYQPIPPQVGIFTFFGEFATVIKYTSTYFNVCYNLNNRILQLKIFSCMLLPVNGWYLISYCCVL